MKRIFSAILALLLIVLPLASCAQEPLEAGYFTRTKRDGNGRFSVSLWKADSDGNPIPENELEKIFEDAYKTFTDAYEFLDSKAGSKISAINAEVETVFDVDKKLITEIKYAKELSDKCNGLYEPCSGVLTALLEKNGTPTKEELEEAISHTGTDKFEFSKDSVKKTDAEAMIDLGALCDGYALDAACDFLDDSISAYGTVTFNGIAGVFGKKPEGGTFSVEIGNGEDGVFNVTDGYVALVSADFGKSWDYTDGVIDTDVQHIAVYASDARVAAVVASVCYAHGSDSVLPLYVREDLDFEAVILKKDGKEVYTENAMSDELYTPITTATEEE